MHVPKNPFDSTAPSDFTPPVRQQFKLSHSVKYASCLRDYTALPFKPVSTKYLSAVWGWYLALSLLP